jgi:hypothetical protein
MSLHVRPVSRSPVVPGLLACLFLFVFVANAPAALDPELKDPYQLRIVLGVAEHRMLTLEFQNQLEADLRDQLQLTFGKLAQVEVVRGHPLLSEVRTKGLQAVLDTWDELSKLRTYFVLVDFADGQYQIEVGFHDGPTGLSSPTVRHEHLSDRQRVGDVAAQAIRKGFGVVGTFQAVERKEVRLAIKGGELTDALGTWVKRGDVFAVVKISDDGGTPRGMPIEWAVLQAIEEPAGGVVRCRYFCRYSGDEALTDGAGVAGYRCLKLNTGTGKVRVRLVDQKTQEFLDFRVEIATTDSFDPGTIVDGGPTIKQGYFESKKPLKNVAYVRVMTGSTTLVHFPVPLVDDRTVVCWMSRNVAAIKQAEVEQRRDQWVRGYLEAHRQAEARQADYNAAYTEKTLDLALKLGKQLQDFMAADFDRLKKERDNLVDLAAKNKMPLDFSAGNELAAALVERQDQLAKHLANLEQHLKQREQSPALIATLQKADLLEKQADFDKAIEMYQAVVDKAPKGFDVEWVKERLNKLQAAWKIKGEDHRQARQFIYDTWPGLDLEGVKANLVKAKESFQRCKDKEDYKTALKLMLVNVKHATKLAKENENLRKAPETPGKDNRAALKETLQLMADLQSLQKDVSAWVAKDRAAK